LEPKMRYFKIPICRIFTAKSRTIRVRHVPVGP